MPIETEDFGAVRHLGDRARGPTPWSSRRRQREIGSRWRSSRNQVVRRHVESGAPGRALDRSLQLTQSDHHRIRLLVDLLRRWLPGEHSPGYGVLQRMFVVSPRWRMRPLRRVPDVCRRSAGMKLLEVLESHQKRAWVTASSRRAGREYAAGYVAAGLAIRPKTADQSTQPRVSWFATTRPRVMPASPYA